MFANSLSQSVERFARHMVRAFDDALDRPWGWQSYNSEGVRFAFFRTYEELRDLAARLAQQRFQNRQPPTEAQHILARYHAAYRDLKAVLLGLTAEQLELPPAENEWPVRRVLAHLLQGDIGFYVLTRFALDRLRKGETEPVRIPDDAWSHLSGLDEAAFDALMETPLAELPPYYDRHHAHVVTVFASLSAEELDGLSFYWENEPYPLRFRLHRFDSHLRQHTIQIDKTLAALGLAPNETRRLLRLIYAALAEVEGLLIGFEKTDAAVLEAAAQVITTRLAGIEKD